MVEKVWVGKKVQVLSLEELKKNHFKDENGDFWYNKNEYSAYGKDLFYRLRYNNRINNIMQGFCGKVCEVTELGKDHFKLKEDSRFKFHLWMIKEPISIEDILNND